VTKAEDGGLGGEGAWVRGREGTMPGNDDSAMDKYIAGRLTTVEDA